MLTKSRVVSWPFIFISSSLSAILLCGWIDLIFSPISHPLYNGTSIFLVFLASLVILAISFLRGLVPQLTSLILSLFYTQRVIVTYFVPDDFTYDDYVHFNYADIENAALFYLLSTMAIIAGYLLAGTFRFSTFKRKNVEDRTKPSRIKIFLFAVDFLRLSTIVLWVFILFSALNIYLIIDGFAAVGAIYRSDETLLKWFSGLGNVFGIFPLFCLMYFTNKSDEFKLARTAFIVLVIAGLFGGNKGALLTIAISYYVNARVLGINLTNKFYVWSAIILVFSIFIFFPLMLILRNSFMAEHFNFDLGLFGYYSDNAFLAFSNRLGGFDWMTLWLAVPQSIIPPNASLLGELITHVNSLVTGDLIEYPESVNLSKLMVVIGRGVGDLNELGGHGENLGGLATAYVFFGQVWSLAYLAAWAACLFVVERSHIHPFHKAAILSSYCVTFLVGGGFVLVHSSYLHLLILTTLLAATITITLKLKCYCDPRFQDGNLKGK